MKSLYSKTDITARSSSAGRYRPIPREPLGKLSTFPAFKFWGYGVSTLMENILYAKEHNGAVPEGFKPLVFGIGTNENAACNLNSPVHSHDYTEMIYILKGNLLHKFHGKEYIQKEGSLLLVPPFFSHKISYNNHEDTKFIQCDFSEHLINPELRKTFDDTFKLKILSPLLLSCSKRSPLIAFHGFDKQYIEGIFHDLTNEYHYGTVFSLTHIRLHVLELLSFLFKKMQPESPALPESMANTIDTLRFIREHAVSGITLQETADYAELSTRSLSQYLKDITDYSFSKLVNYYRIHHAHRLLLNSDKSLSYICHNSGFCDLPYFCNTFRKYTGMTPIDYREKFGQSKKPCTGTNS